jgi:hypothetical protein
MERCQVELVWVTPGDEMASCDLPSLAPGKHSKSAGIQGYPSWGTLFHHWQWSQLEADRLEFFTG